LASISVNLESGLWSDPEIKKINKSLKLQLFVGIEKIYSQKALAPANIMIITPGTRGF
jgi:hypothetical protein